MKRLFAKIKYNSKPKVEVGDIIVRCNEQFIVIAIDEETNDSFETYYVDHDDGALNYFYYNSDLNMIV